MAVSTQSGVVYTGVCFPPDVRQMALRIAVDRAERKGGRISVSATLADLVREAAAKLAPARRQ